MVRIWLSTMPFRPDSGLKVNFLSRESKKIYSLFLLINVLIYLTVIFIPVKAQVENYIFLILINSVFISLVLIFSILVEKVKIKRHEVIFTEREVKNLRRNTFYCCAGSFVGIAMVAYDRIYIRGISYLQGLRAARYEWLASDGGSLVSIMGNILIPFSYVGLFLIIANSRYFVSRSIAFYTILFLLVIFSHAALNGGRSNILLAIIVMILAFSLRSGRVNVKTFMKVLFIGALLSVPAFIYVTEIIKSSASMGSVDLSTLLARATNALQGKFVEGYLVQESSEAELLSIYILSYLSHGQWTAQVIGDLDSVPGSYFLYPFSVMLARLSLISAPLDQGVFSDAGAFVSLPAAIYYDFGFVGLAFISVFIGALFGLSLTFLKERSRFTGWKLGLFIYLSFILLLSPVIPAYGFSYLNLIVFSFFILGSINRLFYGKGYRLL